MDTLPSYAIYTVLAVIGFALIVRLIGGLRRPKDKNFKCARCGKVTPHSARTIQVWRNGSSKFYCAGCHSIWLQQRPERPHDAGSSRAGCMSVVVFVVLAPLAVWAAYRWL